MMFFNVYVCTMTFLTLLAPASQSNKFYYQKQKRAAESHSINFRTKAETFNRFSADKSGENSEVIKI